MASKYAGVTPGLPRFQQETKYQDKVNETKNKIFEDLDGSPSSSALVHEYVAQRGIIDDLKATLSEANLRLEALAQMITDQFDDEDVTSLKIQGATVRVQIEPYASVKDRDLFRRWCIANGLEESLQLPWQSTNSITKERLLAGDPEPDGVEAFQKSKLVLTRDKARKPGAKDGKHLAQALAYPHVTEGD